LEVLNTLPHKVCYKPYLTVNRRYSDIDPILEDLSVFKNVHLNQKNIDMRYLIKDFKICITTLASSTFTWPLLAGKPTIFINNPYIASLTNEVYPLMEDAVFLFDRSDVAMHTKLANFLSQDIHEIEKLYHAEKKIRARKKLINEFFSRLDGSAGKEISRHLNQNYFT